jgi:hypothetical protein
MVTAGTATPRSTPHPKGTPMSLPKVTGTARLLTEPTRKATKDNKPMSTALIKFTGWRKDPAGKWVEGDSVVASAIAFEDVARDLAGFTRGDNVEVDGTVTGLQVWKDEPRLNVTVKSVAAVEKRTSEAVAA